MFEGWEGAYIGYVTEQTEVADAGPTDSICYL